MLATYRKSSDMDYRESKYCEPPPEEVRHKASVVANMESLVRMFGLSPQGPRTHGSTKCRRVMELLPDGTTRTFDSAYRAAMICNSSRRSVIKACDSGGIEPIPNGRRFKWSNEE